MLRKYFSSLRDAKKKLRLALCSADSVALPMLTHSTRNGLPDHTDPEGKGSLHCVCLSFPHVMALVLQHLWSLLLAINIEGTSVEGCLLPPECFRSYCTDKLPSQPGVRFFCNEE